MYVSRYADAGNAFQHALALDPDNRNAKNYYGATILYSTGDISRDPAVVQGGDSVLMSSRVQLLTYQRNYRQALALLDRILDTPDNFSFGGAKVQQQADLYRLMGDKTHARPLYAQALLGARAQLAVQQGINLTSVWQAIADDELGLGHTAESLDAVGKAQAIDDKAKDHIYGPRDMVTNAQLYAIAHRPDLSVPLLTKALVSPGIGGFYSPVLL